MLHVSHQQVNSQSAEYLNKHSVLRGSDKAFDMEILLDFPEKYLDSPALFVDVGDGLWGQMEVVGQELEVLSGSRYPIRRRDEAAFLRFTVMVWSEVRPVFLLTGRRWLIW